MIAPMRSRVPRAPRPIAAAVAGFVAVAACNRPRADPSAHELSAGLRSGSAGPRRSGAAADSTQGLFIGRVRELSREPAGVLTFRPSHPAAPLPPPGDSTWSITSRSQRPLRVGVAVWQKQGNPQIGLLQRRLAIREAGFYRDTGDTTSHGSGIVVVNGTAPIDRLVIDFGNMHRICTTSAVPVKRILILAYLASAPLAGLRAQDSGRPCTEGAHTLGQPLRAYVRWSQAGAQVWRTGRGRYRLTCRPTVVVRIDHIGFEAVTDTVTLAAGDSLERDYRSTGAVELQPTIVTAAKRSQFSIRP